MSHLRTESGESRFQPCLADDQGTGTFLMNLAGGLYCLQSRMHNRAVHACNVVLEL